MNLITNSPNWYVCMYMRERAWDILFCYNRPHLSLSCPSPTNSSPRIFPQRLREVSHTRASVRSERLPWWRNSRQPTEHRLDKHHSYVSSKLSCIYAKTSWNKLKILLRISKRVIYFLFFIAFAEPISFIIIRHMLWPTFGNGQSQIY